MTTTAPFFFHVGPQKSGTTWLYRCLAEHPRINAPARDTIHYYDMFFHKGRSWYEGHFDNLDSSRIRFDPTYSYLRSPWAARRIAADFPNARIAFCLRNPLERAFSHYWHEKKKLAISYEFSDVLENYDLYAAWVEPGMYAEHIERFKDHFPDDRLLFQRFDRLEHDPRGHLDECLRFLDLEPGFTPTILHQKINPAGVWHHPGKRSLARLGRLLRHRAPWAMKSKRVAHTLRERRQTLQAMDPSLLERLLQIFTPEIERVENLLGWDLSPWKRLP